MPLAMMGIGRNGIIRGFNLSEDTKRHLKNMGLIIGEAISVVSEINGNIIVNVKGSRIALSKGIAQGLIVDEVIINKNMRHRRRFRGGLFNWQKH